MHRRNIIRSIALGILSPRSFIKTGKKSPFRKSAPDRSTTAERSSPAIGSPVEKGSSPDSASPLIPPHPDERLFFARPGQYWNSQAMHIGNGYLGLSFLGGVVEEVFSITEKSLWTGGPGEKKDYFYGIKKGGREYLPEIRKLILSDQVENLKQADKLVEEHFWGEEAGYGHFSAFGRLSVLFDHGAANNKDTPDYKDTPNGKEIAGDPAAPDYRNYMRSLDLSESIARVQYEAGGVRYLREYFCSYPDKVAVMRFSSGKQASLSFRLKWKVFQKDHTIAFEKNVFQLSGTINGNKRRYCLKMQLLYSQGEVSLQGEELVFSNAGPVTILLTAATEYKPVPPLYNGADPDAMTQGWIDQAKSRTFDILKSRHVTDYRRLYDRTRLTLPARNLSKTSSSGEPSPAQGTAAACELLPTNERWERYKKLKTGDPGLKVLYFNLGRYLLISSSRPGSLPANLQGAWNMVEAAPWSGNYQSNINVQLNYSGACSTGLSECMDPYIDWIKGLVVPGKAVAKEYYGSEGWVSHPIGNIWGYCAPGFGAEWGMYPAGAAWHCHFIWKKFAYSRDHVYLERTGYPVLKEASAFWLRNLVEYKGWLISGPSGSAEHGAFLSDGKLIASGSSYGADVINIPGNFQDIEMIRELFDHTIEAAALLKTDQAFSDQLKVAHGRLMPFKIGRYGQLQEWEEDIDTPGCNHRHIAHLYAVWPAQQISPFANMTGPVKPVNAEWVAAAKKALELRGEDRNYKNLPHKDIFTAANWSLALRMACWIRLQEAERAGKIFTQLVTEAGFENLLTFQQTPAAFTGSLKEQPDVYYFSTPEGSWTPVWQIDASLAIPGLLTEMLLQSYEDHLFLLPALPADWPEGKITGIRAEGNLSVDMEWNNGKVTTYRVSSPAPRKIRVHVNGETKELLTSLL